MIDPENTAALDSINLFWFFIEAILELSEFLFAWILLSDYRFPISF